MATVNIPVAKAAYIRNQNPTINIPGTAVIQPQFYADVTGGTAVSYNDHAFLGFGTVSGIAKKRIVSASLNYYVTGGDYYNYDNRFARLRAFLALGEITAVWVEGAVSAQTQPPNKQIAGSNFPTGSGWQSVPLPGESMSNMLNYGMAILVSGEAQKYANVSSATGWIRYDIAGYQNNDTSIRPYLSVTVEDIVPGIGQPTPSAGYIDERITNRFTWTFVTEGATIEAPVQQSARFRWRVPGQAYTEIVVGANGYIDIPASTFPAQSTIEWQLQVTSNDGINSAWTPWYTLTTIDSAPGASGIRPSGQYLIRSQPIDFIWRHASESGTAQTMAELQVRYGSGEWQPLATITGAAQTYTLPANTLQGGRMAWRVRTHNTQGVPGEWSEPLENVVITAPDPPIINPPDTTRSRPLITWQAANQASYQLQMIMDGATVIDTGIQLQTERQHQITDYLHNGQYTVRVRVANEYAYWSEWAEYTYTINAYKPEAPTIHAAQVQYGVRITWGQATAGITRLIVYRRQSGKDTPLAELLPTDTGHIDYRSVGFADYYIRAIDSNDNFADTSLSRQRPDIDCMIVAPAGTPEDVIELRYREGEPPSRSRSINANGTTLTFEGRTRPTVEFGDTLNEALTPTISMRTYDDLTRLEQMVATQQTLIMRDQHGRRSFCVVTQINIDNDQTHWPGVSLSVLEVDVVEDDYLVRSGG